MDAGCWIRAARRARRLSQRELAEYTGIPASTIARAESGANSPRLQTFVDLMASLGYDLLLTDWHGRVLRVDEEHERFRDTSNRRFPAHLESGPTPTFFEGGWWGYYKIAWHERNAPPYTYWKRIRRELYAIGENGGHPEVWADAT